MPDPRPSEYARPVLRTIVQRLIDAGHPEEDIAVVIRDFDRIYTPEMAARAGVDMTTKAGAPVSDVFHNTAGQNIAEAIGGAGEQVWNTAKSIGSGILPWNWQEGLEAATAARRAAGAKADTAESLPERLGYTIAGALPFVGPVMAQAGEQFGSGQPWQMGAGAVNMALATKMGTGLGRTIERRTGPLGSPALNATIDRVAKAPGVLTRQATSSVGDAAVKVATHPVTDAIAGGYYGYQQGGLPGAAIGAVVGAPAGRLYGLLTRAAKKYSETPAGATTASGASAAPGVIAAGGQDLRLLELSRKAVLTAAEESELLWRVNRAALSAKEVGTNYAGYGAARNQR